ncbi:hypothetical protein MAUB1S_11392 [Mycolicibacterium aubagnense]
MALTIPEVKRLLNEHMSPSFDRNTVEGLLDEIERLQRPPVKAQVVRLALHYDPVEKEPFAVPADDGDYVRYSDHVAALEPQEAEPVAWRPIAEADNSIATVQQFGSVTLRNSYPIWARDSDGRTYEAVWTDHKAGYWWDLEAESPVDPVEFMPHPLDPRFAASQNAAKPSMKLLVDKEWLKRKIEEDGHEGEIGAGFELFPVPASEKATVTDAMVEAAVLAWRTAWNGPLSAHDPVPEAMRVALSAALSHPVQGWQTGHSFTEADIARLESVFSEAEPGLSINDVLARYRAVKREIIAASPLPPQGWQDRSGCCSAISPCSWKRRNGTDSVCPTCLAAFLGAQTDHSTNSQDVAATVTTSDERTVEALRDEMDKLWRMFVAQCESIEDAPDREADTQQELGFYRGERYAAKSIRRAVEHPKYNRAEFPAYAAALAAAPLPAGPSSKETGGADAV